MTTYGWRVVDDTSVKRTAFGSEHMFCAWGMSVKGYVSPLAALSLQTKLGRAEFRQNLKDAWMALRFEAPGIATKILISGDSFEFEYVSPTTEEQVNEWVATTLLEKSSCKSPQDLISSLVNDAEEREKYCPEYAGFASRLYFASGKEEGQYHICLYSQHAALDGRGSLLALDILLRHLPAPEMIKEWGGEIDRLPLSASYAIGLRKDGDVAPEGFAGIMQAMQDQQTKHQPFCTLPHLVDTSIKSGVLTDYARLDMPAHITSGIKRAEKAHNIAFSYIVAAAVSMAIYRNSPIRDTAKAVLLPAPPIDLRFRLPADQRRNYLASGILAAGLIVIPVDLLKEIEGSAKGSNKLSPAFWQTAGTVAQQYEAAKTSELGAALDNEIALAVSQMFKDNQESVLGSTGFYSPIGMYDTYIKKSYGAGSQLVEVSQPLMTANSSNSLSLCLHTWSWQGQFSALINYTTEIYTSEMVEKYLEDIRTFLELLVADQP